MAFLRAISSRLTGFPALRCPTRNWNSLNCRRFERGYSLKDFWKLLRALNRRSGRCVREYLKRQTLSQACCFRSRCAGTPSGSYESVQVRKKPRITVFTSTSHGCS